MSRLSIALATALFLIPTTSNAIDYTKYERGDFWCNEQKWGVNTFDKNHLNVAKRGYLYVLAAALALQKEDQEAKDHFFSLAERMKEADRPARNSSGFEVVTFEIYSNKDKNTLQEVVIAFTGSNDIIDWAFADTLDKRQYQEAVDYVKKISQKPEYKDIRIVVSGFSLGGALAVHVTKNQESSPYISEAWALNPSPKIHAHSKPDERIWLAAVRREFLSKIRKKPFRIIPGISNIGAPPEHTANDYYLVKANPGFGHFRYVLTRNILFAADIAMSIDAENQFKDEPLSILKSSVFSACKSE